MSTKSEIRERARVGKECGGGGGGSPGYEVRGRGYIWADTMWEASEWRLLGVGPAWEFWSEGLVKSVFRSGGES
jgi:hypothetical protein